MKCPNCDELMFESEDGLNRTCSCGYEEVGLHPPKPCTIICVGDLKELLPNAQIYDLPNYPEDS